MVDQDEELLVDTGEDFTRKDYSHISVQELYRPVRFEEVPEGLPILGSKAHLWWAEQIKRCKHGWIAPDGKFINGYHYFFINFVTARIWDTATKKFVWKSPLWRDNDADVLDMIWYNRPTEGPDGELFNARNHIEAKARGIAWTTYTLLGVKLYTFVFHNDLPVGSAYPDEENVAEEKEWFIRAWELLHPVFRSWEGKTLEVLQSNEEEFVVGWKLTGKTNRVVNKARFDVIGTENAGVYKGDRMRLMIAVEAGKWKKNSLNNYISENEPSATLGTVQWGMFLVGGTSNAIINGSTAYRDLYFKHKSWNATAHFSSKTKVLFGHFDEFTGKSNEVTALKHIRAIRDSKLDNPILAQQDIIENPLNVKEAFIPNMKNVYNAAAINKQIQWMDDNHIESLWERGRLEWDVDVNRKRTGTVSFEPDPKGEWLVNLEGGPRNEYENLHVAGIDDRYKSRDPDKPVDEKASKNCMIVYRQPTIYPIKNDMPVGVFLGDDADMENAFDDFYKGMIYWNIRQTMYEYNADTFTRYLRERGESHRLFHVGDNVLPGTKITPKLKTELTGLGSKYFNSGRYLTNTSKPIMEAMTIWGGKTNTDIGSAFHLVLYILHLTENFMVTELKKEKEANSTYVKLGAPAEQTQQKYTGPATYHKLGVPTSRAA